MENDLNNASWIILDIDNCMYEGFNPDGSFVEYKKHMRGADENWAVSLVNDLEGLRAYRKVEASRMGMDASLLKFLSLKTGREYDINDLAEHRGGPKGYMPEKYLQEDKELVDCLKNIKNRGVNLAAATDNPVGLRVLRTLGVGEELIPNHFVFDSVRLQTLKSPEFYQKVMSELGISPTEGVVYGDSEHSDVEIPKSVGLLAFLAKGRAELLALLRRHFLA